MKTRIYIFIFSSIFFISCQSKKNEVIQKEQKQQVSQKERVNSNMKIISTSFKDGDMIPSKYTCDGANTSPQLSWSDFPEETKSFSIICDDPDAPMGTWVHWVIFNIPANIKELQESIPKDKTLDNGIKQGKNDFGKTGYDGPCPPGGTHHYFFKLYAIDKMLVGNLDISKQELLDAIEGHILGQVQMVGKYKR